MKMESKFRKIEYFKKSALDLTKFSEIAPEAMAEINKVSVDGTLVVRLGINSPVVIEAAAPLTLEGIRKVSTLKEE